MRTRSLVVLLGILLAAALALGALGTALAHGPYGSGGGPGGMWGPGGMMGGRGPMMGGWGWASPAGDVPQTLEEARAAVEGVLAQAGRTDLAVTEVMEFERNFYASVAERDTGQAAMEVLVHKPTGQVFPEYGPNMMWNTQYGHMGGAGGHMGGWWGAAPGEQATVTPERAQELAQGWLDTAQPGSTAVDPVAFPGYFTLHSVRDGQVTGMLSVHATTGAVWYHDWHGRFIATTEAGH